jgi:hypothetical protein
MRHGPLDHPVTALALLGRMSDAIRYWAMSPDDALTGKPLKHNMVFYEG